MRRHISKSIPCLTVSLLMVALFTGCTQTDNKGVESTPSNKASATPAPASGKPDTSKPVNLTMYLTNPKSDDIQILEDELNKMLKQDINTTVKISLLTNDAYKLMLTSGEDFDLAYSASWLNYADNARKGAFKEITPEMLKTYAPLTAIEEKAKLSSGYVDGKMFGLPAPITNYYYNLFLVRGDLMKKYNAPDIKSLDDLGVFLDAVKKNEPNIIPFNLGKNDSWMLPAVFYGSNDITAPGAANSTSPIQLRKGDNSLKLNYALDMPEVVQFLKTMKDWKEKGFWAKNTLANPVSIGDSFKNGKSAVSFAGTVDGANASYFDFAKEHPDWDVRVFPAFFKGSVDAYSYSNNSMVIGAKSKNAERALMVLDLLRNNEKYNVLSKYGVEGKHYTLNAEGKISYPGPSFQGGVWGVSNDKFIKTPAVTMPNYADLINDEKKRYKANPLVDFVLNTKDISDVAANIANLYTQYGTPLFMGFVDDVDKAAETYKQKLKEAGVEKYVDATKAQMDEYMKNHK
ncbi:ABC transporter substrate-binding protein [Paenibacillus marchantiophytorum]|uniref:ABC transporter substrate-binding protein n=2 Tax=Paenibacillus marchantiophytorum TaxID=1619310 RepID=A0ABQ1EWH3_9BACL|nr:ABC transporter substrate-binding protein [Paenibacillus marchantiophytorum]